MNGQNGKKKVKKKEKKRNQDPSLEAALAKVAINGGELARCTDIMRGEKEVVLMVRSFYMFGSGEVTKGITRPFSGGVARRPRARLRGGRAFI